MVPFCRLHRFVGGLATVCLLLMLFPSSSTAAISESNLEQTAEPDEPGVRDLATRRRVRYTVQRGDTLSGIARDFGVTVTQIRDWNELDSDFIREGQVLVLRVESSRRRSSSSRDEIVYIVESGDTVARIAARHDVSVRDLLRWNRGMDADLIRIGQEIRIRVAGGSHDSSSIGRPDRGRLSSSHQLESGPGYRVRSPSRAYGTRRTVNQINRVFERVASRYPNAPRLAIGDLSYARGGRMRPHVSHQSGRDADIAYYTVNRSDGDGFVVATPRTLDVQMTWYLLKAFIDTGDVRYIFIDYDLQEVLYDRARLRGASEEELEDWFQYPSRGASRGIIRDSRGHDDHFHIRFRCTSDDGRCRD